mgnify:CR=1 FL=1
MDQAKEMAKIAFEALEDKKGEDVCAIDISAVSVLADYFVIANGNSDSQVRALAVSYTHLTLPTKLEV